MNGTQQQQKVVRVALVEKHVDLLSMPTDSDDCIVLDYDPKTLRLRYLIATPA